MLLMPVSGDSSLDECLAVAHERRPDDARRQRLAADLDRDRAVRGRRHAREADGALERRRERAAGHLALARAARAHALVRAEHAALLEQEADELALHARLALREERFLADEIAVAVQRHGPGEARLERRHGLVHVVA